MIFYRIKVIPPAGEPFYSIIKSVSLPSIPGTQQLKVLGGNRLQPLTVVLPEKADWIINLYNAYGQVAGSMRAINSDRLVSTAMCYQGPGICIVQAKNVKTGTVLTARYYNY